MALSLQVSLLGDVSDISFLVEPSYLALTFPVGSSDLLYVTFAVICCADRVLTNMEDMNA